jgi:DNA-binding beta-propeller fold protein YncE
MAVRPDGRRLYVPNFDDGTVAAVEIDSKRVDTFASGAGTIAVAVTPDGGSRMPRRTCA